MKYKTVSRIFVLAFFALIGFVSAQSSTYQYGMMGSNGEFTPVSNYGYGGMMGMMQMMTGNGAYAGYSGGVMFLGWITYLLTIALIVSAIYWLIKSANRKK